MSKTETSTTVPSAPLPGNFAIKLKGLSGAEQFENWKLFKFQFNNYMVATRQDELTESRKIAILLHLLGAEVVKIYESFNVAPGKKLEDVIKLFDKYFSPKKNLSLERNVFLSRRQLPGESLEMFFTNLKNLSATCELGELQDSLVKDMFIVGLLDENSHIKERLLEDDSKSLNEIFDWARTIEMSRDKTKSMFAIHHPPRQSSSSFKQPSMTKPNKQNNNSNTNSRCQRCGLAHWAEKCPASKAKCNSCGKTGHYSKMCRRKVHGVQKHDMSPDDKNSEACESSFFIGAVNHHSNSSQWKVLVKKPGDQWQPATVCKLPSELNSKRAYQIVTPDGSYYVRNRIYLRQRGMSGMTSTELVDEDDGVETHNIDSSHDEYLHGYLPIDPVVVSGSQVVEPGDSGSQIVEPSDSGSQVVEHSGSVSQVVEPIDSGSQVTQTLDTTVTLDSDLDLSLLNETYPDDPNDPDWTP
ncbi:hypothetical protein M8J77_021868 [Diaphorina citri]|nr:hypothetical protein M8J77_021868 [Diaphorina citri]